MPAGLYDINAEQGATLRRVVTWRDQTTTPVPLTGYTAKLQVRKSLDAATTLLSLTHLAGLSLGTTTGTITILVTAAVMSQIPAGSFYYDLELTSASGEVTRLLQGRFNVSREVTRGE